MNTAFFAVESEALEHVVLLELIAYSRAVIPISNDEDGKVSCETNSFLKRASTARLPDVIQRVLGDRRALALARDLLASGALRVFVDADTLERRCELIERQWRDQYLLCAFVERQASVPMIRTFFRTATRSTIARLRYELDVAAPTKPRVLSLVEIDALFGAWTRLAAIDDLRERYLALHLECQGRWSLATLFAALSPDTGSCGAVSSSPLESHHVRHAP